LFKRLTEEEKTRYIRTITEAASSCIIFLARVRMKKSYRLSLGLAKEKGRSFRKRVQARGVAVFAVLCFALFLQQGAASGGVYTFEGTSTITQDSFARGGVSPTIRSEAFIFQVESSTDRWLAAVDITQIYFDGTNVMALLPGGGRRKPGGQPVDGANVYAGPIPFGSQGHLQACWLAYASRAFLEGTNARFPDLASAGILLPVPDLARLRNVCAYDSSEVRRPPGENGAFDRISLFRLAGGNRVLGEALSVKSQVDLGGARFPKEFDYTVYSRTEAGKVLRQIAVSVTNTHYAAGANLSAPRIGERGAEVGDMRFSGSLTYKTTDWRAESDLREDPAMRAQIQQAANIAAYKQRTAGERTRRLSQARWFVVLAVLIAVVPLAAIAKTIFPSKRQKTTTDQPTL
jgi:hypothetical protein